MPACPHCAAENQPSDRICIACGKPLDRNLVSDDLFDSGVVCATCDAYNEPNAEVCTACGQPLTGVLSPASEPGRPEATLGGLPPPEPAGAESMIAETNLGIAGMPSAAPQAPSAVPPSGAACPFCQARLPTGAQACLACGRRLVAAPPPQELSQALSARLRLVDGCGRKDAIYAIGPGGVSVGRLEASICFADDRHLSPKHLRLRLSGGCLVAEDLGSYNGSFVRIRGRADVKTGAEFIAGGQRMVLLGLGGPTTDIRAPSAPDTRTYGGPHPRQLFVALRQLHVGGDGRARAGVVHLRSGPVISIGRQGCNISFPADAKMALKHIELHLRPSGVQLVEVGSQAAVFLRIRSNTSLQNGDEIRIGEEILRVEMG